MWMPPKEAGTEGSERWDEEECADYGQKMISTIELETIINLENTIGCRSYHQEEEDVTVIHTSSGVNTERCS